MEADKELRQQIKEALWGGIDPDGLTDTDRILALIDKDYVTKKFWNETIRKQAAYYKEQEGLAIQAFCQEIADKIRLEYQARGRYPGHIIDPWIDVARPIIYKALSKPSKELAEDE